MSDDIYKSALLEIDKKIYQMKIEFNEHVKNDVRSYVDNIEIHRFRDVLGLCWKLIKLWLKLDRE